MTEHELHTKVRNAFHARFQEEPAMIIRAPGRVNIIGEHTDYNDGFVLPVAVDRAAWLAVSPSGDELSRIRAVDMGNDDQAFMMDDVPVSNGGWADYPKGVVWAMLERGLKPVGIHGVLTSDVPVGAGMSSSAAIEVAFAYAWNLLSGIEMKLSDLALLCQRAENQYVGVNCGIMDQMISACGKADHAMMLDTRTLERAYFNVPEDIAIIVANSMVRRSLTGSEYNVRRAQCEQAVSVLQEHYPEVKALRDVTPELLARHEDEFPEVVYRRARHVVTENARVLQVARDLYEGRMAHVGELLLEGHRSLRDDYEVSIPELDTLVEAAAEVEGCYGARLTGAGFGGCIIALADADAAPDVEAHLVEVYEAQHDRQPTVYVSRADNGVARMA
ncbi:MAG: galactokinase [Anaerolineae bacterium]|nr:galactokinase [Anaerolineae bacterium]